VINYFVLTSGILNIGAAITFMYQKQYLLGLMYIGFAFTSVITFLMGIQNKV